MVDGEDETPAAKKARSRVIQACIPCHRSKRRCNRKRPCSQCLKRQNTANCVYEGIAPVELAQLDEASTTRERENEILRARIADLEGVVATLRREVRSQGPERSRKHKFDDERQTNDAPDPSSGGIFISLVTPSEHDPSQQSHLPMRSGEAKSPFPFLKPYDRDSFSTPAGTITEIPLPLSYGVPEMLVELHRIARGQLEHYLDAFFEHIDPFHHYLPRAMILQRVEECIEEKAEPDPATLAVVFAVIALGEMVISNSSSSYMIVAALHLTRLSEVVLKRQLDSLATIYYTAVYLHYQGRLEEYWLVLGIMIRLAQAMGLHRDPDSSGITNVAEAELRRRFLWGIAAQDVALSLMFGRHVGFGAFDCKMPADLSDNGPPFQSGQVSDYPYEISFNKLSWDLTRLASELLPRDVSSTYEMSLRWANHVETRLSRWHDSLPPVFRQMVNDDTLARCKNSRQQNVLMQSTVLFMSKQYHVLLAYRVLLLTTYTPTAMLPCLHAAISVIEDSRKLQDSFTDVCAVVWLHWFYAYHSALICYLALRTNDIRSEIGVQAFEAWSACLELFRQIESRNESIRYCLYALVKLDQTLPRSAGQTSSPSIARSIEAGSDSLSRVRISDIISQPDPPLKAQGKRTSIPSEQIRLPPLQSNLQRTRRGTESSTLAPFRMQKSEGAQETQLLELPQALEMFVSEDYDGISDSKMAIESVLQAKFTIFDMDASHWPSWVVMAPNARSDFVSTLD